MDDDTCIINENAWALTRPPATYPCQYSCPIDLLTQMVHTLQQLIIMALCYQVKSWNITLWHHIDVMSHRRDSVTSEDSTCHDKVSKSRQRMSKCLAVMSPRWSLVMSRDRVTSRRHAATSRDVYAAMQSCQGLRIEMSETFPRHGRIVWYRGIPGG